MPLTTTFEANRLLLEGSLALSEIEGVGVRVDREYVKKTIEDVGHTIRALHADMQKDPVFARMRRRFGDKTKLSSADQVAKLVFEDLGYTPVVMTEGGESEDPNERRGRASASAKALEHVDIPFVKNYLLAQKYTKLVTTYLGNIMQEMVQHADGDWYVHPSYNLNTVVTFRSSCNNPNYQNIYKRDPAFAAIMRKAYRSRREFQLGECDYSSAEVKVAANYTLDPTAMREAMDPKADPHREAACKLLHLRPEQVNKYIRNTVKAAWVFAQFYGDYYLSCARNIWFQLQSPNAVVEGATDAAGKPLHVLEHLKAKGIKELGDCDPEQRPRPGTFEAHAQQVEEWYWGVKYPIHTQWKRDWYNEYLRRGGFMMKTGFAVNGVYKRNEVINSPIQGSSFHCLLKAMIRIVKLFKKYKFKSRVIGEVHDSLNLDIHPSERDDVINLCRDSMTTWLVKQWPWLVVPPQVEPECCPVDGSWYDLAALKEQDGIWVPADADKWAAKYGDWSLQS